jgi:hypothetical protein
MKLTRKILLVTLIALTSLPGILSIYKFSTINPTITVTYEKRNLKADGSLDAESSIIENSHPQGEELAAKDLTVSNSNQVNASKSKIELTLKAIFKYEYSRIMLHNAGIYFLDKQDKEVYRFGSMSHTKQFIAEAVNSEPKRMDLDQNNNDENAFYVPTEGVVKFSIDFTKSKSIEFYSENGNFYIQFEDEKKTSWKHPTMVNRFS